MNILDNFLNMDDYYLGGRSFGPFVLMATVCATIIGGSGTADDPFVMGEPR